jgi:hypothetical protein
MRPPKTRRSLPAAKADDLQALAAKLQRPINSVLEEALALEQAEDKEAAMLDI